MHIGTKALLRVLLKLSAEQHNLIKMTTIMTFYHHLGEFIMIPLVIKCFLLVFVAFDLKHRLFCFVFAAQYNVSIGSK